MARVARRPGRELQNQPRQDSDAVVKILDALEALGMVMHVGVRGDWLVQCPAHDDAQPSLHVSQGRDERALLHCFAGCRTEEVLATLGLSLRDLGGGSEVHYVYRHEDGYPLHVQVRAAAKRFSQFRVESDGSWTPGLGGLEPVPYNLPALHNPALRDRIVFITEGEKDADTVSALGEVATCFTNGSNGWQSRYKDHFRDREVTVVADNDTAGYRYAAAILRDLTGVAASVQVLVTPDPVHKDVTDLLEAGMTFDALVEADQSRLTKAFAALEPRTGKQGLVDRIKPISALALRPPVETLVAGLVPVASMVLLYGMPESYKSFHALDFALSVASGEPFLGRETVRRRVIYVAAEGVTGLPARVRAWLEHRGLDLADIDSWFQVIEGPVRLHGDSAEHGDGASLREILDEQDVRVLVVDTLARCMTGLDENTSRDMGRVVAELERVRQGGVTILVVHHSTKTDRTARGSSALDGAMDVGLHVRSAGKGRRRIEVVNSRQKELARVDSVSLRVTPVGESIVLTAVAEEESELNPAQEAVLDAVRATPGLSPIDYVKRGVSKATGDVYGRASVLDAVRYLVTNDFLVKEEGLLYPHGFQPGADVLEENSGDEDDDFEPGAVGGESKTSPQSIPGLDHQPPDRAGRKSTTSPSGGSGLEQPGRLPVAGRRVRRVPAVKP